MESANYIQPILFLILPLICFISIYVRKKTNKDYNLIFCFGSIFAFIVALIPYGIESGGGTVDFDAVSSMTPFIWIFVVISSMFLAIPLIQLFLESFEKFKDSFNDVFPSNKNSLTLKKESEKVDKSIKRLKQIREMNINAVSLQRTRKLCQLVTMANKDSATQDFDFVEKQFGYLEEAKNIEQSIRLLIQKYMQLGDSKKSTYYFTFLNSSEKSTDEASIENEGRALLEKRNEDKKTVKKWAISLIALLLVIVVISLISYQQNTPYRNLKSEILANTLSYEKIESNYEEYIETKKGMQIIENAFADFKNKQEPERAINLYMMLKGTYQWAGYEHEDLRSIVCQTIYNKISEYHSNDDYIGALKLLDYAPDYIYDDNEISSTYAHWLADSAIKNHKYSSRWLIWNHDYTEVFNDYSDSFAYEVDEYIVIINDDYEDNKDLTRLSIINSEHWDFDKNTKIEFSDTKDIYRK